jgi:hypothetical protein
LWIWLTINFRCQIQGFAALLNHQTPVNILPDTLPGETPMLVVMDCEGEGSILDRASTAVEAGLNRLPLPAPVGFYTLARAFE